MIYYHGSPFGNIKVLEPRVSNHDNKYVYLTTNEVVATLYMVDNNFYTYGFQSFTDIPVYTEYFPDALREIYSQTKGYLYRCSASSSLYNPTNIGCAFVCEEPVQVIDELVVADVYDRLMMFVDEGRLLLRKHEDLSIEQIEFIESQIFDEIITGKMQNNRDGYLRFIRNHFPHLWNKGLKGENE